jgi:hypothetical protein
MAPQMRPTSAFRPLQSLDGHLAVFGAALDVLAQADQQAQDRIALMA